MVHRFPNFEIDEPRRELRSRAGAVALQPRVFDVLVYLAKHRDRVVGKEEILDAVWSDVVVADGSLQRAVSLLRGALEKLGARGAIRTYARRGYRLCVAGNGEEAKPSAPRTAGTFREMDTGELLSLTQHAQCSGRDEAAIAPLERAVPTLAASGEKRRAAWIATLVGQVRLEWRDFAQAKGWHHRARRLLEGESPGREHGYLAYLGSRIRFAEGDIAGAGHLGAGMRAIGQQIGDADLENLGLVCFGEAEIILGRVREGLAALDEAGAAMTADPVSPWAGAMVFCGLIYSSMARADWQRAGEWTEQFSRWGRDKGITSYPGLCRMHRAEVLTVRGQLDEADDEIRASLETLARNSPWVEGEILRVQGDCLLARGEFAAARKAFTRAMEVGWDTRLEIALVALEEGDAANAAGLLARAIEKKALSCLVRRGRALVALATAAARAGRISKAQAALRQIDRTPELASTPGLTGLWISARAEIAAARRDLPTAVRLQREAVQTFRQVDAHLAAAHARVRLGEFLVRQGEAEIAGVEFASAEATFAEARATAHASRTRVLRKKLKASAKS